MTERHLVAVPPEEDWSELERLLLMSLQQARVVNQILDAVEQSMEERK